MDIRVGKIYKLGPKVGSGSFGTIYRSTNAVTGEECAMKLEQKRTKYPQLMYEAEIYESLAGGAGIPKVLWVGREGDYNVMVMDLLGPALEDLLSSSRSRFSLKTVLMIADQLITRLEYLHSKGYVHRDVKPDNFLIGLNDPETIFMIDFGLCRKYLTPTGEHVPFSEGHSLTGTVRYAAINTHLGYEQSRRDDMESLGFVLVYLLKGELPWQGMDAKTTRQKYQLVCERKQLVCPNKLCQGIPAEFIEYFKHVSSLKFEEQPDYNYLRGLFRQVFEREGFEWDYKYDWLLRTKSKESKVSVSVSESPDTTARNSSSSNNNNININNNMVAGEKIDIINNNNNNNNSNNNINNINSSYKFEKDSQNVGDSSRVNSCDRGNAAESQTKESNTTHRSILSSIKQTFGFGNSDKSNKK